MAGTATLPPVGPPPAGPDASDKETDAEKLQKIKPLSSQWFSVRFRAKRAMYQQYWDAGKIPRGLFWLGVFDPTMTFFALAIAFKGGAKISNVIKARKEAWEQKQALRNGYALDILNGKPYRSMADGGPFSGEVSNKDLQKTVTEVQHRRDRNTLDVVKSELATEGVAGGPYHRATERLARLGGVTADEIRGHIEGRSGHGPHVSVWVAKAVGHIAASGDDLSAVVENSTGQFDLVAGISAVYGARVQDGDLHSYPSNLRDETLGELPADVETKVRKSYRIFSKSPQGVGNIKAAHRVASSGMGRTAGKGI